MAENPQPNATGTGTGATPRASQPNRPDRPESVSVPGPRPDEHSADRGVSPVSPEDNPLPQPTQGPVQRRHV